MQLFVVLMMFAGSAEGRGRSGGRMGGSFGRSAGMSRRSHSGFGKRRASLTRRDATSSAAAPAAAGSSTTYVMGGGGISPGTFLGLSLMDSILAEQRRAAYMRQQLEMCVSGFFRVSLTMSQAKGARPERGRDRSSQGAARGAGEEARGVAGPGRREEEVSLPQHTDSRY